MRRLTASSKKVAPVKRKNWWDGMKPWAGGYFPLLSLTTRTVVLMGKTAPKQPSSNPICPACLMQRLHMRMEMDSFHPLAGHGVSREHGALKPV